MQVRGRNLFNESTSLGDIKVMRNSNFKVYQKRLERGELIVENPQPRHPARRSHEQAWFIGGEIVVFEEVKLHRNDLGTPPTYSNLVLDGERYRELQHKVGSSSTDSGQGLHAFGDIVGIGTSRCR
jgi:hypothetical protein